MKKISGLLILFILVTRVSVSQAQNPQIHWDFENITNRKTVEIIGGKADTLEGYFGEAAGVKGKGLALDGFTACLKGTGTTQLKGMKEFTVEAWIALGE
ncbi:MAG: hypothetical protein WC865_18120, partial [Bacteroidales bacterium]